MKTRQNNYARRVAHAGLALLGAALLLVAAPGTWAQTYTNLHTFAGGANDGAQPVATTLTLSGTNLYGMTYIGGAGNGVIFKLNADGSGYTNLHAFTGSVSDGALPIGSLTLSGTNLY